MSSRHLPAGQNIPPGPGGAHGIPGPGGMPPPVDMTGGPPAGAPAHAHHGGLGHGPGPGPRRRQPPQPHPPPHPGQYAPRYHQHMNPHMYPNYVPYGPQQYHYGMPPQYQNGAMPGPPYMPYQNYPRSPPAMHQYSPMVGVTVPPNYPRHSQPSPALSTPYQPPPAPAPIPPQTPSSTHSSQMLLAQTPPTPQQGVSVPPPPPAPASEPELEPALSVASVEPFRPPLPWFSRPDEPWPARKPKTRRTLLTADSVTLSLPVEQHEASAEQNQQSAQAAADAAATPTTESSELVAQGDTPKQTTESAKAAPASPSTPSQRSRADTVRSNTSTKPAGRGAQSAAPAVPAVPKQTPKPSSTKPTGDGKQAEAQRAEPSAPAATDADVPNSDAKPVSSPPQKPAPTSWAGLLRPATTRAGPNGVSAEGAANGDGSASTAGAASTFPKSMAHSVAEAVRAYRVGSGDKVSFIEPRGLINTGNMCYMNSVLQVLMFCAPFYNFLDQVSKRAAHSFKSETPLIDAMVMFMNEFKVLKSTGSVEQLRRALKAEELEKFGEPFTPEFVYEAIRQLPRFASMRRGHQQDAEEFLGFLLQSLDDECTHVMGTSLSNVAAQAAVSETTSANGQADAPGDWLEVGRKQKAAVTRSSGSNASTPINKIFGGLLRSELRVPGLKDSITTEPYQPLQLDIGSPDVRNVVDALRGLTRPERLQGDFNSPRGKDVLATKQVFIESLPPVLILHLKRFQFDAEGRGTVKIWKHIDYPLDLEIPREALSRQKRQTIADGAMPKYKLISVVYHHGKNASGGHYTVDVRRQDSEDWLRLDDTVLRRVHSADVAGGASEEEAKDSRKETPSSTGASANRFEAMNEEEAGDEDGWKQVTASSGGNKRWSNVVNGAGSASKGKHVKESVKDNKVAYLLFYQRV